MNLGLLQESCTFLETRNAIAAAGPGDHIVALVVVLIGMYLWTRADDENWHKPIIIGVVVLILLNLVGMNPSDAIAQTINRIGR